METRQQEFLDSEPLRETDEHTSDLNLSNSIMTEEEREEIQLELAKLEDEISTLKQVLASKEKRHTELKHKLGITPLSELRSNLSRGWTDMQSSTAYKRTSETLSSAGQKTTAAFSTLGSAINRKFGDVRLHRPLTLIIINSSLCKQLLHLTLHEHACHEKLSQLQVFRGES
ncbi:tumor protein D53 isoform X6 [Syngnathus scovelli]|uniref:tumor protein D53 isoform X6 n=1 Tax=Syngnathus scovelli TaxID=161590 RepID=UPI00210FD2DD|nr:tumor protein D53 isoform X6 [Syngnathus scovelli]